MIPMTWDSLRRIHKMVGHLLSAAAEIDELGPNIGDIGLLSELLKKETGFTIWKLRDCCFTLCKIEREERERAKEWERHYLDHDSGPNVV